MTRNRPGGSPATWPAPRCCCRTAPGSAVEAFQSLGRLLGSSTGSDELHYLLEGAFDGDRIADAFLYDVYGHLSFATGPLYAALHEPCYAQGRGDPLVGAAGPGGVR